MRGVTDSISCLKKKSLWVLGKEVNAKKVEVMCSFSLAKQVRLWGVLCVFWFGGFFFLL